MDEVRGIAQQEDSARAAAAPGLWPEGADGYTWRDYAGDGPEQLSLTTGAVVRGVVQLAPDWGAGWCDEVWGLVPLGFILHL